MQGVEVRVSGVRRATHLLQAGPLPPPMLAGLAHPPFSLSELLCPLNHPIKGDNSLAASQRGSLRVHALF